MDVLEKEGGKKGMEMTFRLLFVFFKIGLFSIGGGYAVIPMIQEQIVEKYGWVSQKVFTDIIAISQMTPGPLAVNASTFVGLQSAGIKGAVAATTGCVAAGICISLSLYVFFRRHSGSEYVMQILCGLKAVSVGLIASAGAVIMLLTFGGESSIAAVRSIDWKAVVVFAAALAALRKFRLNPVLIMMGAGFLGYLLY